MPKKKSKQQSAKNLKVFVAPSYLKIILFVAMLLVVGIIVKSMIASESYKVLGVSTLLARGGDDSGGGSNSGSGSSGSSNTGSSGSSDSSGTSGSGSSGSGSSGSSSGSESNSAGSTSKDTSVSDGSKVLCIGPDGKRFETKQKDCEELNKAWNKQAIFTIIKTQPKTTKTESRTRSASPSIDHSASPSTSDTNELEDDDAGIRTKTETKLSEEKTEVRLSETERIRTRTKDGRTRIDITSDGIKTRLEIRDDRVVIKAEQEDGTEVELEDDTLLKIDDRLAKDNIKVATAGAERFLLQKGTVGAVTNFPLSVDLATNTVFINTPSGQKAITILPEQVIQNLIAANVVNRLGGRAIVDAAANNNLTSVNQLITLGERNGIPVYEINGISDQKLLGFIPVLIEKDITVSAETGNAVFIDQPFSSKILDAISF